MIKSTFNGPLRVLLLLSYLLLAALPAHANLIDRGIYTYDNKSKLDWLDLNVLAGYSYQQVRDGAGGYLNSGWRFATTAEILDLFTRYVGPVNGAYAGYYSEKDGFIPDFSVPNAASPDMLQDAYDVVVMMGMNLAFNDDRATYNVDWEPAYVDLHQVSIQGYYDDLDEVNSKLGIAELTAVLSYTQAYTPNLPDPTPVPYGRWDVKDNFDYDQAVPWLSSFLVRDHPIPSPSTGLLLLVGMLAMSIFIRGAHETIPEIT